MAGQDSSLNPVVLLSLIHDLQSRILQLLDANTNMIAHYETKLKELQEEKTLNTPS